MSRLNPRRHACFSRGGVFEYDDLTTHGNHNPHNVRAGALLIHRPAWVDQHTGGSRLTPTVHRCPKGMAVGGSSPQHKAQHTVQKHGKHFSPEIVCTLAFQFPCWSRCTVVVQRTAGASTHSTRPSSLSHHDPVQLVKSALMKSLQQYQRQPEAVDFERTGTRGLTMKKSKEHFEADRGAEKKRWVCI